MVVDKTAKDFGIDVLSGAITYAIREAGPTGLWAFAIMKAAEYHLRRPTDAQEIFSELDMMQRNGLIYRVKGPSLEEMARTVNRLVNAKVIGSASEVPVREPGVVCYLLAQTN